jgi:hypothetical protein
MSHLSPVEYCSVFQKESKPIVEFRLLVFRIRSTITFRLLALPLDATRQSLMFSTEFLLLISPVEMFGASLRCAIFGYGMAIWPI